MFRDKLLGLTGGFCDLSGEQLDILQSHYELLVRWNRRLNLTRIVKLDEALDRHYAESLFLGAKLPSGELTIVDVGSGGGFPGLPVAVLRPECRVTLVECHQRKAVFLKEASRGLSNVNVIAKRAEVVRDRFDWVISRAVGFSDLASSAAHLSGRRAILGSDGGIEGTEVIPLPWAPNRNLLMFHVEHLGRGVSRETSSGCDRI